MYLETTKHEEEIELPYTMHIDEHAQQKKETIAYRFWFDYMHHLQETNKLAYASFTRFHKLEDQGGAFTVAVVFQVEIGEQGSDITWGDVTSVGTIENIV